MAVQQHSANDLYDLGWKKGNRIFIDGKRVPNTKQAWGGVSGTFLFDHEEDHTPLQRNIYYSTQAVQGRLL